MIKIGLIGIVVLGALLVYGGSSTYAKEETAIPVYSYDLPTVTPTPAPTATPTVLERLKAENEEKEREEYRDKENKYLCDKRYMTSTMQSNPEVIPRDLVQRLFERCFDEDGNWKWVDEKDPHGLTYDLEAIERIRQHINDN